MITLSQIKKDYSVDIAEFLSNGGEIKPAVNNSKPKSYAETNTFLFNSPNRDRAGESKINSHQNSIIRENARKADKKSYVPVTHCGSCGTSERSVRSNACLECDRRRARAKLRHSKNIDAAILDIAAYLVEENKTFEFTIKGKKYTLKVEEV
ncbi:hypothetical protein I2F17_09265 [Acinetobacter sp. B10A]|uniref:hypothetical protein n=1 Tax=Acinetobacter baretiae TaxID=2605383 RepID=UPI001B3C5E0E|nr:hypothetical protein [Acinetobacter baretiae]MBF7686005.1 hypothetical protein [Acinetobacter baretiae]